jgi:NDP-sugar pyrophosphorylase family protein
MQALILAGGLGTRLRAVVNDRPKPMASIENGSAGSAKPFLEYQLEFLKSHRITHMIFCVGHLHQHIQKYFGNGSQWGVRIDYSIEEKLLGTGGAIKHAENYLNGTFLALNGDSFFGIDLGELIQFHLDKKAKMQQGDYLGTIALTEVQEATGYGLVTLNRDHRILNFAEKSAGRSAESSGSNWVNAGIYILEPETLNFIPPSRKVSIERETFPSVLKSGRYLGGYCRAGFFVDIGTPAGYRQFRSYVKERDL